MTFVELCAGAGACTLRLLGGPDLVPPVAWMGGKRRYAADILGALDCWKADRIVLVDAGPWGWIWPLIFDERRAAQIGATLRGWEATADFDPRALWGRLKDKPPLAHPAERAAQWLWLQARSASGVPVFWGPDLDEDGWRMGEELTKARRGTRTLAQVGGGWLQASGGERLPKPAYSRDSWVRNRSRSHAALMPIDDRGSDNRWTGGGLVYPSTIAQRVEDIATVRKQWGGVLQVIHRDVRTVAPLEYLEPVTIYFDPPYRGRTGYGWTLSRADVVDIAERWADQGAVVAVSEAEPLDELEEWHTVELAEGKEHLTMSRPPAAVPPKQLSMWSAS